MSKQYDFGSYSRNMQNEMKSADDMWAQAHQLRAAGRNAEADRLETQAERMDNRHSNSNYSVWLDRQ